MLNKIMLSNVSMALVNPIWIIVNAVLKALSRVLGISPVVVSDWALCVNVIDSNGCIRRSVICWSSAPILCQLVVIAWRLVSVAVVKSLVKDSRIAIVDLDPVLHTVLEG